MYTEAIEIAPQEDASDLAVYYSNRAACYNNMVGLPAGVPCVQHPGAPRPPSARPGRATWLTEPTWSVRSPASGPTVARTAQPAGQGH